MTWIFNATAPKTLRIMKKFVKPRQTDHWWNQTNNFLFFLIMGNGWITTLSFFDPGPIISIKMIILFMLYGNFTGKFLKRIQNKYCYQIICTNKYLICLLISYRYCLESPWALFQKTTNLCRTSVCDIYYREINTPRKNEVCGQLTVCCSSFFWVDAVPFFKHRQLSFLDVMVQLLCPSPI
jgi:hypothetical protein